MKNFCTDIIETAKMRGIGRSGAGCRSKNGIHTYTQSYSETNITIMTTSKTKITYEDGSVEYVESNVNNDNLMAILKLCGEI